MFLSCQRILTASQRRLARVSDQRGSALMAVIAVMGVTLLIAMIVASVTLQALSFTSSTRAGVQSKAAANAGIDAAMLSLLGNSCAMMTGNTGIYPATTLTGTSATPGYSASYEVQVQVPNANGVFATACPTADSVGVKLVSTGTASAKGVAGNSSNDTHTVEAMYAQSVSTGGPAIYSYKASTLNNFTVSTTTVDADVNVKTGDMSCVSATIQGSVHVAAGSITLESSCKVSGAIYASGDITIRGYVAGNVYSGGKVTMAAGARVGGTLTAGGNLVHDNDPQCGPSTDPAPKRAKCYLGTTNVSWTRYVPGAPDAPQVKTGENGISYDVAGVQAPHVPDWQDFRFNPTSWIIAGYSVQPMPASWCTIQNTNSAAVAAVLNSLTSKTVYNATGVCSSNQMLFSSSASLDLQLKTDVAFITPASLGLEGVRVSSADARPHQFLLITPDAGVSNNAKPDEPTRGCTVNVNSNVVINAGISALIYSPCKIKNSANGWRGQLYGGITDLDSAVAITFETVAVPGLNLAGETPPAGSEVAAILSNRTYLRDLDG